MWQPGEVMSERLSPPGNSPTHVADALVVYDSEKHGPADDRDGEDQGDRKAAGLVSVGHGGQCRHQDEGDAVRRDLRQDEHTVITRAGDRRTV